MLNNLNSADDQLLWWPQHAKRLWSLQQDVMYAMLNFK